jgi:hypothetical protein
MITCSAKESLIKELKELRPSDPAFVQKFDEVTGKLKQHITSGHPHSKHNTSGKPCNY